MIIDDIITELNRKCSVNNFLPNIINREQYIKTKMRKRYGEILYKEYEIIISDLIKKVINSDNPYKIKRDVDILFCECDKNTRRTRSNSWNN